MKHRALFLVVLISAGCIHFPDAEQKRPDVERVNLRQAEWISPEGASYSYNKRNEESVSISYFEDRWDSKDGSSSYIRHDRISSYTVNTKMLALQEASDHYAIFTSDGVVYVPKHYMLRLKMYQENP